MAAKDFPRKCHQGHVARLAPHNLHVGTGTGLDAAGATEPTGAVGHLHQGTLGQRGLSHGARG